MTRPGRVNASIAGSTSRSGHLRWCGAHIILVLLIQAAKAKARGYGTVKHLITISYLVAGKLTHLPASPFNLKACITPAA